MSTVEISEGSNAIIIDDSKEVFSYSLELHAKDPIEANTQREQIIGYQKVSKKIMISEPFARTPMAALDLSLHKKKRLEEMIEKMKPIIESELETWTELEKVGEGNSTSLKETFSDLKKIMDDKS